MAKKTNTNDKTTQDYISELKSLIEQKGGGFDPWLLPLLRATAMNMVILDKIQSKLETEEVTSSMTGSMGQQKIDVHPLIDKYDKMQNTLVKQYEALGLTAKGKGGAADTSDDDDDPVLSALTRK